MTYDVSEPRPAESVTVPRLLPWATPEGKPCYLLTDEQGGPLSRRADALEASQIEMGHRLLGHSDALVGDPQVGAPELRYLSARLTEALRDSLRIAESRGARLSGATAGATEAESAVE
ncbi:hypothetical protein [Streptomyces poonensis]|uniref:Uncharacterized protein n=1 Tax=Streptomyces poonensis TaxID=68255 RepID=A0A918PB80_9ACTN|nr:hypothetical protein [Streptomyces poonensis]GGY95791.1 hypothetical protein GCM10010365_13360 [Streptomyces poonensis]GLJ88867.1 hypothetical protein GCM10017589_14670 [Streptomyces poonensis]